MNGNNPPVTLWQRLQWPDGAIYEGLVTHGRFQSHGVFQHTNGDRYEGEFVRDKMDGYGAYVWADGTVYRGEWRESLMHGCGAAMRKDDRGVMLTQEGKFFDDEFVGPIMSCSVAAAQQAASEADVAASLARSFQTDDGRRQRQAVCRRARDQRLGIAAVPPAAAPTSATTTSASSHAGSPSSSTRQALPLRRAPQLPVWLPKNLADPLSGFLRRLAPSDPIAAATSSTSHQSIGNPLPPSHRPNTVSGAPSAGLTTSPAGHTSRAVDQLATPALLRSVSASTLSRQPFLGHVPPTPPQSGVVARGPPPDAVQPPAQQSADAASRHVSLPHVPPARQGGGSSSGSGVNTSAASRQLHQADKRDAPAVAVGTVTNSTSSESGADEVDGGRRAQTRGLSGSERDMVAGALLKMVLGPHGDPAATGRGAVTGSSSSSSGGRAAAGASNLGRH